KRCAPQVAPRSLEGLVPTIAGERVACRLRAPLPIMPKACLRHDAGRGRRWGYQILDAACGFTPPLTPPRHHAGGVSSTRREGKSRRVWGKANDRLRGAGGGHQLLFPARGGACARDG